MNLRPFLPHLALLICVILFSFAVKTFASTSIESTGVFDGGYRVYSAVNPPPATDTSGLVPKDGWWSSTYYGSNGDIYMGWAGSWLSTVLSQKAVPNGITVYSCPSSCVGAGGGAVLNTNGVCASNPSVNYLCTAVGRLVQ